MNRKSPYQWTRRQPFEPFRLRPSNGAIGAIRPPDMILPTRQEVIVAVPAADARNEGAERGIWIACPHIVQIGPLDVSAPKEGRP